MASENILLNPLPELKAALSSNTFGISSSSILENVSFPITEDDLKSVKEESNKIGMTSSRVVGKAVIELLGGEGKVGVRLDRGGWTVESAETQSKSPLIQQTINKTYESLETLLIDISPSYTKAMNEEIWKRFGLNKDDKVENEEHI